MTGDGKTLAVAILAICTALLAALIGVVAYAIARSANEWPGQVLVALERQFLEAIPPAPTVVRSNDHVPSSSARPPVPPADARLAHAGLRGNPAQWFGDDAYPADAIRAGEQGRTVTRLVIDSSGTPISCTIITSSGSRSLDAATCAIALRRITFDPARDGRGAPIASVFTLPVRWILPAR